MSSLLKVEPYDFNELCAAISAGSHNGSRSATSIHAQSAYLSDYLDEINAKTFVVEGEYVDKDFLEDYAGYYSRCFQEYRRFCRRIHFFGSDFGYDDLKSWLSSGNADALGALKNSYLGFMVVRPLPVRVKGRTCLSVYPDGDKKRHFPANRRYTVNFFGVPLEVSTVAWQEQDKEVAACATSALWSVFQATGPLFHHPILSPVDITKAATELSPGVDRSFPTKGLTELQQTNAMRAVGLEPLLIGVKKEDVLQESLLKGAFYAYVRARLPILISMHLQPDGEQPMGLHAVTGVGYRFSDVPATSIEANAPLLLATKIDRIYVHDDQTGPFSRLRFENGKILTSWEHKGAPDKITAVPRHLIVPLYHKIRNKFFDIYQQIAELDAIMEDIRSRSPVAAFPERLVWDIYLTNVTDLKSDVLGSGAIDSTSRFELLTKNMPKYIWRATALTNGNHALDLLFDATDLSDGASLCEAVAYEKFIPSASKAVLERTLHFKKPATIGILQKICGSNRS